MSFYIDPNSQQRIYITTVDYHIIQDDVMSFSDMPSKYALGSFISRIIQNYYRWGNLDSNEDYTKWMKEIANSKNKRGGKSIRLLMNRELCKLLMNLPNDIIEKFDREKDFIEELIHQYASLPYYLRECIYFFDIYNAVYCSIEHESSRYEVEFTYAGDRIKMKPVAMIPDRTNTFNYVIGFSSVVESNEWIIRSYRLQRIQDIIEFKARRFSLSRKEASILFDYQAIPDAIPYIGYENVKAEVRLTDKGDILYKKIILFQRPRYSEITCDEPNNHRYIIECSEEQLYNYFIKFGADVEIISPYSLRNKMKEVFAKGYRVYNK